MVLKRWIIAGVICMCSLVLLQAQDESEPADLVTDRPDKTESSSVVPKNSLQLEAGLFYTGQEDGITRTRELGFADALLRFGLLKKMELRLGFGYAKESNETLVSGAIDDLKGFAPVAPGLKVALMEENGWIPEMALLTHLFIPFGDSEIGQSNISHNLVLAASHTLSSRVGLGYNFGVEWGFNDHDPIGTYSVVAGFGVSESIGAFIETFGEFGSGMFSNSLNGGITFLVLPNLQLDVSGSAGLNKDAPDFMVGGGFSVRLPH